MKKLIAIIGPTAVGKTRVSIDLAKKLNTEIISGDSMLVYKGMDIGTAKPTAEERDGINHYLIDILEPSQEFSVVDFKSLATQHITAINGKQLIPILAGGTGLYVKALLEGYVFDPTPGNEELRARLQELAGQHGSEYIHQMLTQIDPTAAARLHPNDLRRLIRAYEVAYINGTSVSQRKVFCDKELMYDVVVIGLTMERSLLYQRINQRVDKMIIDGLVDEVNQLLKQGVSSHCQSMQAIGYRELVAYLKGEMKLDIAIDKIKQATRHFAKRQMTWYRKMPYIEWFDVNDFSNYDAMLATFYNGIAGKFSLK